MAYLFTFTLAQFYPGICPTLPNLDLSEIPSIALFYDKIILT